MEFYKTKKTLTELGYSYRDNGYYNPAKCGDKYFIESPRITELGYSFTRDYNGMTGYIRDRRCTTRSKKDVIAFLFGKKSYVEKPIVNNSYVTCITCGQIVTHSAEYERKKHSAEQQLLSYETMINEKNTSISSLQGQLNGKEVYIAKLIKENEDMKRKLLSAENEVKVLQSKLNNQEEENMHIKEQLKEKDEQLSALCFENNKKHEELQQLYASEIGTLYSK